MAWRKAEQFPSGSAYVVGVRAREVHVLRLRIKEKKMARFAKFDVAGAVRATGERSIEKTHRRVCGNRADIDFLPLLPCRLVK